jgi:hypothetical protein
MNLADGQKVFGRTGARQFEADLFSHLVEVAAQLRHQLRKAQERERSNDFPQNSSLSNGVSD